MVVVIALLPCLCSKPCFISLTQSWTLNNCETSHLYTCNFADALFVLRSFCSAVHKTVGKQRSFDNIRLLHGLHDALGCFVENMGIRRFSDTVCECCQKRWLTCSCHNCLDADLTIKTRSSFFSAFQTSRVK